MVAERIDQQMKSEIGRGRPAVIDPRPLPWWKRAGDLVVAGSVLVLVSPILIVLALLVRIALGAPVLFRQPRSGWRGEVFEISKFRTMLDLCDVDGRPLPDHQRRHWLGNLLRASSLDELPALWNVVRGDMTLVGPRPLIARYLDRYDAEQIQRLRVHPGLTGLAQVSGRNALSWDERFALDLEYVDRQSPRLDLWILWATIRGVLGAHGADGIDHTTEFMGSESRPPGNDQRPAGDSAELVTTPARSRS